MSIMQPGYETKLKKGKHMVWYEITCSQIQRGDDREPPAFPPQAGVYAAVVDFLHVCSSPH
jgi:hypothetical protein